MEHSNNTTHVTERSAEILRNLSKTEKECYALLALLAQGKEAVNRIRTEEEAQAFDEGLGRNIVDAMWRIGQ